MGIKIQQNKRYGRMQRLNRKFLEEEYDSAKKEGIFCYGNKKFNHALTFFEFAAQIAWSYPILPDFCDDELETYLDDIANTCFKTIYSEKKTRRIVFYNGQILDFGALTEQYLDYFIDNDFEVLFIVPNKKNTKSGQNILKKIDAAEKVHLFIPSAKKPLEKIRQIREQISAFNPEKAFLHFLPNDVTGFCSFASMQQIERFYIVHNDHTFWLGKKCSDFFIEFRGFGIAVATEKRKISKDKIFYLPFYPIKSQIPFQGFPFDRSHKIIAVSGANLYKYLLDKELRYFHIIKELLYENENLIFCLCGKGYGNIINNFITENKLQERFYYLGQRSDFSQLVSNCDILFESYPSKGGLTPLFAIETGIPVLGIANFDNASGSLEDFLGIPDYKQPCTFKEFKEQATLLINSAEKRKSLEAVQQNNFFKKRYFTKGLTSIIKKMNNKKELPILALTINMEYYLNEYLNLPFANIATFQLKKLEALCKVINIKRRLKLFISSVMDGEKHKSLLLKGLENVLRIKVLH